MEAIHQLVLERNSRETLPFVAIHESNARLVNQVDALQARCEELEHELIVQREVLDQHANDPQEGRSGTMTQSIAMKNETRLREKLEKLQEDLHQKLKIHADAQATALQVAKDLATSKDSTKEYENALKTMQEESEKKDKAIEHLQNEMEDAKSRTKLAEQQYVGLKDTIRTLQEENDELKKINRTLETRLVTDKETLIGEMNQLSESCERLKKEVDMLRSLKADEDKRKSTSSSWFGMSKSSTGTSNSIPVHSSVDGSTTSRKFSPQPTVVIPSKARQIVRAHAAEASCVRYDGSDDNLVATGGADSMVQVFDTSTGGLKASLRAGSSNAILSCDISNGVVVAGGSDKTCRVWNHRTQRMVHQLVGHSHKITCTRLFGGAKNVITGSADRSLRIWDISRQTYRQAATLRHSATANTVDVGIDSTIAATGHVDGGVRFWDIQAGDRSSDISGLHEGAVTSVQFHPKDTTRILTNGMDSCIKIVDVRTSAAIQVFRDPNFQTSYGWSSASFSPDGKYVASGSSSNGNIFVWNIIAGKLQARLQVHQAGVCGFGWGRGGKCGQQVASVDKNGMLILWV